MVPGARCTRSIALPANCGSSSTRRVVNHLAKAGLRGGEQRGSGGDFDGFRGGAELEVDIDLDAIVDADLDAGPHPFLEAGMLAGDGIRPTEQVGHSVVARVVGLGRSGDAGFFIDGANLGSGNRSAARIADASQNSAARILGETRRQAGRCQDERQRQNSKSIYVHAKLLYPPHCSVILIGNSSLEPVSDGLK